MPPHGRAPHRKRPNYRLRRLVLLLLLLSPAALWYGYQATLNVITVKADQGSRAVQKSEPAYVMLMGVDERLEDSGRSDTMILLRLGRDPQRLDLISLPRDTRITLHGQRAKLNAAYSDGGADQVCRVVAQLLGIPKPHYVKINLQLFEEIVDQLGGVELTLDRDYYYEDPYQELVIDLKAGRQVMDGEAALHFVRLRYDGLTNDDIGRIGRQQQFLRAARDRFADPSSWPRMVDLIRTMRAQVATDITEKDQLPLASALFAARSSLTLSTLPGLPEDESGDWLLNTVEWNEVKAQWSRN